MQPFVQFKSSKGVQGSIVNLLHAKRSTSPRDWNQIKRNSACLLKGKCPFGPFLSFCTVHRENIVKSIESNTHQSDTWSTLLSGFPSSTSQNPESPLNISEWSTLSWPDFNPPCVPRKVQKRNQLGGADTQVHNRFPWEDFEWTVDGIRGLAL